MATQTFDSGMTDQQEKELIRAMVTKYRTQYQEATPLSRLTSRSFAPSAEPTVLMDLTASMALDFMKLRLRLLETSLLHDNDLGIKDVYNTQNRRVMINDDIVHGMSLETDALWVALNMQSLGQGYPYLAEIAQNSFWITFRIKVEEAFLLFRMAREEGSIAFFCCHAIHVINKYARHRVARLGMCNKYNRRLRQLEYRNRGGKDTDMAYNKFLQRVFWTIHIHETDGSITPAMEWDWMAALQILTDHINAQVLQFPNDNPHSPEQITIDNENWNETVANFNIVYPAPQFPTDITQFRLYYAATARQNRQPLNLSNTSVSFGPLPEVLPPLRRRDNGGNPPPPPPDGRPAGGPAGTGGNPPVLWRSGVELAQIPPFRGSGGPGGQGGGNVARAVRFADPAEQEDDAELKAAAAAAASHPHPHRKGAALWGAPTVRPSKRKSSESMRSTPLTPLFKRPKFEAVTA